MPHSSRRGWNKVEQVKRKVKDELGMCLMMITSMYWIWASLEQEGVEAMVVIKSESGIAVYLCRLPPTEGEIKSSYIYGLVVI